MDKVKNGGVKLAKLFFAGSMVFAAMTAWGQSMIDGARIERLKTNAKDIYVGSLKVGTGSCSTNIRTIKQTAEGLLLLVDRPVNCGFKSLELNVNGVTLPLSALAGFSGKSRFTGLATGVYEWGEGVASGEMLFTSSQSFVAGIQTLALSEPECPGAPCLNSDAVESKANKAPGTPQSGTSQNANTMGDPNKYSSVPIKPRCIFFDGFADNGNGTVTDPRNGLIWKRCPEGMDWNGSSCTGNMKKMNWSDGVRVAKTSQFLGKKDWRLPSQKEIRSVMLKFEEYTGNDSDIRCVANRSDDVMKFAFGGKQNVWTYSRSVASRTGQSAYCGGSGGDGIMHYSASCADVGVQLVRSNQPPDNDKDFAEYNREYAETEARLQKEETERRESAIRQAEFERKTAAFRKSARVGSDTSQGPIVEIRGDLVKVQTNESQCTQRDYDGGCRNWMSTPVEKWVKRAEIYPKN
jgi:hypothetical protein